MADAVQASVSFPDSTVKAGPCGFNIGLPRINIGFSLNLLSLSPIPLPLISFGFNLSCDPTKPIDVVAGASWNVGRVFNGDPSPDLNEDT